MISIWMIKAMRVGFYFVLAGLIVAGMFAMPILCAEIAAMDAENTADLHVEALDMDCVDESGLTRLLKASPCLFESNALLSVEVSSTKSRSSMSTESTQSTKVHCPPKHRPSSLE